MTTIVKKLCVEFARPLTKKELLETQAFLRKLKGAVRVRAVREEPKGEQWRNRRGDDYHYYGGYTVIGPRDGVWRALDKEFTRLKDAKAFVEHVARRGRRA